jgi:hypothetical protein
MQPTPMMILQARAEARAMLFALGDYACLREATAPLIEYAHDSGLVHQVGIDTVREIIAEIFKDDKQTE